MVTHRAPDVLVVVMDCVSGVDFLGGGDPVEGLRAANSLASEGVVYTKAVAPASWTVPSHASMFAGLYPWETTLDTVRGTLGSCTRKPLHNDSERGGSEPPPFRRTRILDQRWVSIEDLSVLNGETSPIARYGS